MVKPLNKEIEKALDDIITYIKGKEEYQSCQRLKKKMQENKELTNMIDKVRVKQKEYIRSSQDEKVKKELDNLTKELEKFPLYLEYNNNLKVINNDIELLKESLNGYFDDIINFDL